MFNWTWSEKGENDSKNFYYADRNLHKLDETPLSFVNAIKLVWQR